MHVLRSTLREEIDAQVAASGSWDHGQVVGATIARLSPFTHLDLADIVGFAVRQAAQSIGRSKENRTRRAFQRVVSDGARVNKPVEQLVLWELREVIKDYRNGIRQDEQALSYYEALQDAFIAGVGDRPISTTKVGEVVDLDNFAAEAKRAA